jgi:uncharacterized membrane protein YeiH
LSTATYWITQLAVAVSAAAGVLEAGKKRFDLFGMILIAFAAALGGGSLRDVLLNRTVFWVTDQNYLLVALGAGLATFFAARWVRFPANVFLIPDAAGLALFTVAGTNVALAADMPWLVASFMGVITGVMGGVLRDVLCNEEPLVFRGTLYATVAWLGSLLLILAIGYGAQPGLAAVTAGILIFVVRLIAIRWDIGLPKFQSR